MTTLRQLVAVLSTVAVASITLTATSTTTAAAAPAVTTPVVGARDFRSAPVLTDGSFSDILLTGEDLWYGLPIRNDPQDQLQVTASLVDEAPTRAGLEIKLQLVSPTLRPLVQQQKPGLLTANALHYAEPGQTWIWYLQVSLTTERRRGQQAPAEMHITGTAPGPGACDEATRCDHGEVAALRSEVQDLRLRLDEAPSAAADVASPSRPALEEEIAALAAQRDQLKGQLQTDHERPKPRLGHNARSGGRWLWPSVGLAGLLIIAAALSARGHKTSLKNQIRSDN